MTTITIKGKVARGNKIGSRIGFPTANIPLDPIINIPCGVYAATFFLEGYRYIGVVNVGYHPTVGVSSMLMLEAHLLDFKKDIYDTFLEVHLEEFIRPEHHFPNTDTLKQQIDKDIETVRNFFSYR